MTKAELEQIIDRQIAINYQTLNRGVVLEAMVEAYNQAIDDSVELLDDNPEYDIQAVYKLKI